MRLEEAAGVVREAIAGSSRGLVDRDSLVELVALAAVAREHVLVIGPPGTAKSEAVRRIAQSLGGRYFEYLLGRFTEPSEIFGPVDLRRLREGVVETETTGMLPEAEIAFLDEVFLGSTAILNTLLALLNERTFRRGHTRVRVPLRVCVGASNAIPEDGSLAAFADRFLVRAFVEPIGETLLEDLLAGGWSLGGELSPVASVEHLDVLADAARGADLAPIRPTLAHAVRLLRRGGVNLSDRRVVKAQRLVAAAAALGGRTTPTEADLWPIVWAVPTAEGQRIARDALREVLASAENAALAAAAAEASLGPLARASRIVTRGEEVLAARPGGAAQPGGAPATGESPWKLRVEGVLREIDAGFPREGLPPALASVRDRLVAALG